MNQTQRVFGIVQLLLAAAATAGASGLVDIGPHTGMWILALLGAIQGARQSINASSNPTGGV